MIGYRVYIMDCLGHIEDVAAIMADDDAGAINAARQRPDRSWELWHCGRLVQKGAGQTWLAAA